MLVDALGNANRAYLEAGIVKQRPCARARGVGADMPVNGKGWLRPVDARCRGRDFRRLGGLSFLGLRLQRAGLEPIHGGY